MTTLMQHTLRGQETCGRARVRGRETRAKRGERPVSIRESGKILGRGQEDKFPGVPSVRGSLRERLNPIGAQR